MPAAAGPNPERRVAENVPHYPSNLRPIAGTLVSVGENEIIVKEGDEDLAVPINSSTEVYLYGSKKDPAVYEAERQAFSKSIENTDSTLIYIGPSAYNLEPLTLQDLKAGQFVTLFPNAGGAVQYIHIVPAAL